MVLGLAALALALSNPAVATGGSTGQPVTMLEMAGVWMLCYDPALNMGAHELDEAYLMLEPDGRYFRQSNSDIVNPVSSRMAEFGTFKLTSSGIEVSPEGLLGWDGRAEPGTHFRPHTLTYRARARVVLFNDLHRPLELPALCPGEGLNWCYAKVF